MRVLLADDEPKVREALHLILEQLKEVEIVVDASDAVSLAEQMRAIKPDLLLLDWELPGLKHGKSLQEMWRQNQACKVIVMSGCCQASQVLATAGIDAFVSKCEAPDRLFAALKSVGAD